MSIITVRKNWRKKIEALCEGVESITSYRLDNNFEGVNIPTTDKEPGWLVRFVNTELGMRATLSYNKENGYITLHIHSNHWYEWTNKIDW